jgi:DNA-binding response OmpR family regulator
MDTQKELFFPPFRVDLHREQVWRDKALVAVRPKTFAVLRYLVEHAGQYSRITHRARR